MRNGDNVIGDSASAVTELTPAVSFWMAEPERQGYYLERYPNGYLLPR